MSICLTLGAFLRAPVQCWGKDGRGHNLLSNHGLIKGRFIYPPEHSELKGEAGYIFHWQKKSRGVLLGVTLRIFLGLLT